MDKMLFFIKKKKQTLKITFIENKKELSGDVWAKQFYKLK